MATHKEKICRIYAIVNLIEAHLGDQPEQENPLYTAKHAQHLETLGSMRKLATQIQLQFARQDLEALARSEKIFRGLQAMLSPELLIKIKKAGLEPLPLHTDMFRAEAA